MNKKHDARQPTFNEEHSTTDENKTSKNKSKVHDSHVYFVIFNFMFRSSASVFSLFLTIPSVFFRCVLSFLIVLCFVCVRLDYARLPSDPLQCRVFVLAFVCFKFLGVSSFVWVFRD